MKRWGKGMERQGGLWQLAVMRSGPQSMDLFMYLNQVVPLLPVHLVFRLM